MDFINNEEMFEFRSGEVDSGSYVMDGPMPGIHLTRPETIRMLENMKKVVPNMILSDQRHTVKKSYAQAVTAGNRTWRGTSNNIVSKKIHDGTAKERRRYSGGKQPTCWHCGVLAHTRNVCKYSEPMQCHCCGDYGHKRRYYDQRDKEDGKEEVADASKHVSARLNSVFNYVGLFNKGFKLFHLNVCHLTNKIEELHSTVLCNSPKLDACGFSETFLTDLVEDCRLEVEGYTR